MLSLLSYILNIHTTRIIEKKSDHITLVVRKSKYWRGAKMLLPVLSNVSCPLYYSQPYIAGMTAHTNQVFT